MWIRTLVILVCCICLGSVAQAGPADLQQTLASFDQDEHHDLRSVLVLRGGRTVAERYYNGATADDLHDVRSAGKSITALLVGAAFDRGIVRQVSDPLSTYWPAAKGSAIGAASLESVLTMRSGVAAFDDDPSSPGNEDKMDEAADTDKFILSIPAERLPGTQYRYNSLSAHSAGIAVEQASGQDLQSFARKVLFAPLGIERWQWQRDASGHFKGQGNLSLRTRDLAKIGQMVLDGGIYDGRRVISARWLEMMLAPRVAIHDVDRYADDYGYFWYAKTQLVDGKRVLVQFASGNGGNKIYVVPALGYVVVLTSSAYGKGYGQLRSENILKAILAL